MINVFENSQEIVLISSTIESTPIKLYDYIDYISPNKSEDILEKELNYFIKAIPNYKCPFNFNIRAYMNLEPTEVEKYSQQVKEIDPEFFKSYQRYTYSKFMKLYENYFCYYIKQ